MPKFGSTSMGRLETTDPESQFLFNRVIVRVDCAILCGHRGEEEQNRAFVEGKSTKQWPDSAHNSFPSKATDAGPYYSHRPHVRWPPFHKPAAEWTSADHKVLQDWYSFAYYVLGIADSLGIGLIWGGTWKSLKDFPHFERRKTGHSVRIGGKG